MRATMFILLTLIAAPLDAQPVITQQQAYGGPMYDSANEAIRTTDDGFLLVGFSTCTYGAGESDLFLVKTAANAEQEWIELYGGARGDYGTSVCMTPDGDYIAVGWTESMGAGGRDVYMIKVDGSGNLLWERSYGSPGADGANHILPLADGTFLVTGFSSFDWETSMHDVYLLKIDTDGDTLWTSSYPAPHSQRGQKAIVRSTGGFAIAGATGTIGTTNREAYLLLTDSDGGFQSSHMGGGVGYDWAYDIIETESGSFAMTGDADIHGNDLMNLYFCEFDADGTFLRHRSHGQSHFYDYGRAILPLPDGYLMAGSSRVLSSFKDQMYLVKIDPSGLAEWRVALGSDEADAWVADMLHVQENTYALIGHMTVPGGGGVNAMLSFVELPVNDVEEQPAEAPHGFHLAPPKPNPFNPTTEIQFSLDFPTDLTLGVFDLQGRLVRSLASGNYANGTHRVVFDGSGLASGTYYARLTVQGNSQMQRLTLLK